VPGPETPRHPIGNNSLPGEYSLASELAIIQGSGERTSMSALGQQTSPLPQKAERDRDVRFVPEADIPRCGIKIKRKSLSAFVPNR
jgi:hypothetical protein